MPDQKLPPGFVAQQWKPGQSGNPKGRPKRPSMETLVAQILDERLPNSDQTKRELLARVFVDEMLKRNGRMIREYLAREWPIHHQITVSEEPDEHILEQRFSEWAKRSGNGSARVPPLPPPNGSESSG